MTDHRQPPTDRCTVEQLKTLLALARDAQPAGSSVPPWTMRPAEFEERLAELCKGDTNFGQLLVKTLTAPDTTLGPIRVIKEMAKGLLGGAPTPSHRAAATLLYHVTVAAALANHGVNISSRPSASRWPLYEDLAAIFAGYPLGQLFRQAADRIASIPEDRA